VVREIELIHAAPAEGLFGGLQFLFAERIPVRLERILLFGAAIADVSANQNKRRPVQFAASPANGLLNRFRIVAALHVLGMPAVCFKAFAHVLGETEIGAPSERDVILVVEEDQLAELQMAGKGGRFLADAFHEVAVAADTVGKVVHDGMARSIEAGSEPGLRDGQTDSISKTLAERPCSYFYAYRMPALGMAG